MKNSEYWKDRMVDIELSALEKGEKYYKNLQEQYDMAIRNINKDITVWYERLARNNEISLVEAKQLLDKNELKEFHWTLQEYIQYGKENAMNQEWMKELENASAKHHINKLQSLQIQMKQHLEKLANDQQKGMKNALSDIYEDTYYHTAFEIQEGFNVGWHIEKLDTRRIEKVLNTGWADGRNYSDRIWTNKEKLVNTLNTELTQMIIRGERPDMAIKAISAKMGVSKKQAGRLVMTESSMIASAGQKDCFKELGVEEFEIVATLDMNTCGTCGSLDGTHLPIKNYQVGVTAPPFHANCRCCTAPYFADDEGQRIARDEDGKNYYIDGNIKYDDWKEKFVENSSKKMYNELDIPKISKEIKSLLKDYKLQSKVKKIFNQYLTDENIMIDKNNEKVMYYNIDKDKIIINPKHEDFKYYDLDESLTHEIAHMIAIRNNIVLENQDFLQNQINLASIEIMNNKNKYYELFKNNEEYGKNMAISDIFSAITNNQIKGAFYHDSSRWKNHNIKYNEIVANIMTAYITNNNYALELIEEIKPLNKIKELLEKYEII